MIPTETNQRLVARFLGDPRGFVYEPAYNASGVENQWVRAQVGRTEKVVWINLALAYIAEEEL